LWPYYDSKLYFNETSVSAGNNAPDFVVIVTSVVDFTEKEFSHVLDSVVSSIFSFVRTDFVPYIKHKFLVVPQLFAGTPASQDF